ncbi:hypothetical protein ACB288_20740 [Aeromonas taiwanensis]
METKAEEAPQSEAVVAESVADDVTYLDAAPAVTAEPVAPVAPVVAEVAAKASAAEPEAVVEAAEPVTQVVSKGAGVLARARKASAPMATPAAAPAPTPREPVEYAPLVRSAVATSGRHGGSTSASNVATSPAGRP